jgi:hypothetical protein
MACPLNTCPAHKVAAIEAHSDTRQSKRFNLTRSSLTPPVALAGATIGDGSNLLIDNMAD